MDPYKVLGVDRNTSKEDIKKAYRKLAKDNHPDTNGGDDTKFKNISEAYKILTDPKAKSAYEEEKMRTAQRNNPYTGMGGMGGGGIDEMIREFMRQQGGMGFNFNDGPEVHFHTKIKKKIHGRNINIITRLNLEDSFHGKVLEIRIDRHERVNSEKRVLKTKKIKVTIPKGAKNGQQLVLRNQGNQGLNGGKDGDVLISIEIKPHNYFMRKEHDLYATIKIPFTQVILGDSVKFKNIDGEMLNIVIPEGSSEDSMIDVPTKGMPIGGSDARGHLKLIVAIQIPDKLTKEQKDIFRTMQKQIGKKREVVPESIV